MALDNNKIEPEEEAGAPEWMVTFSDCMTLLLTFFVLLLSFSSFDDSAMSRVQESFGIGMPKDASIEGSQTRSKSPIKRIPKDQIITEGSRLPTPTTKALGNLAKKRRLTEFKNQKVFAIDSKKIFAGKATAIHPESKETLDFMIAFLKAQPSRVVICEFDPENPHKADITGKQRAWAIMNYFIQSEIEPERFSITGSSMLMSNDNLTGRKLVITLLEEDVYK